MFKQGDLFERLGLDTDFIQRDLTASLAFADYYRHQDEEKRTKNLAFSATLYRRASAHSLLILPPEDRANYFARCAEAYQAIGSPYFYMMAVFSKEPLGFKDYNIFEEIDDLENSGDIANILQQVYRLIASTDRERNYQLADVSYRLIKLLEPYQDKQIGILGIPIRHYISLFNALNNYNRKKQKRNIRPLMQRFVRAYDDAIQQAMVNRYHWQRLAMPFHPAELDIFSVLLYINRAVHPEQFREYLERSYMSSETRFLVNGILSDYTES